MGFCGCTLQTSAIVAAVFGVLESLAGVIGGSIYSEKFNIPYLVYPINIVRYALISATVFNALWLVATIILIIGIVKENVVMHRLWVGATSVITVADLAHTIALLVGYFTMVSYVISEGYYIDTTEIIVFALVVTAVARGSIWLWIINICLTIYTAHRANEIERGPVQPGTTVIVYGNQPLQPYPMAGQTVIVQHSGPILHTYAPQQQQYGQPQTQYEQPQSNTNAPDQTDQGLPPKH